MQPANDPKNLDDELFARLASNTPRPPIGKCVLIVGGHFLNIRLFDQLVQLQGCATIIIMGGDEGLQAAIKKPPDLIIVEADGSNGFQLARSLKGDERTRDIPLVVVSSHDERTILRAGYEAYDVFVAKPINVLNFLKMIDGFLLPT